MSKFSRQLDGTVLTNTNWNNLFIYNGLSKEWANGNYVVELNVLSVSGNGESRFNIYDGTSNKYGYIETTGVHRFTFEDGTMKHFIDGTEITAQRKTYDNTVSTFQFIIVFTDNTRTMKFKGFKLYSL